MPPIRYIGPVWATEHLLRANLAFNNILLNVEVSRRGARMVANAPALHRALANYDDFKREEDPAPARGEAPPVRDDYDLIDGLARWAKRETNDGFAIVHGHAVVALWGALEVMAHDLVRAVYMNDRAVRSSEKLRKVTVPAVEFDEMDPLERADAVIRRAAEGQGSPKKSGPGRFESVLELFHLGGPVDDVVRRDLVELGATRNVLVHRGGRADRHFAKQCPWSAVAIGEEVRVDPEAMHRYDGAARAYLAEIARRVEARYGSGGDDPAEPVPAE